MAKAGKESTNTDKMVNHQLLKKRTYVETLQHKEVELITASDLLDTSISELYNAADECSTASFLQSPNFESCGDRKTLVSDTDNQLLIKLKFKERVNVNSIQLDFSTPPEPAEGETHESYAPPGAIKVYCNHDSLDFGDLDTAKPIMESNELSSGKVIPLPSHKCQRVDTLHIFVAEGNPPDAPFTFVNQLYVMGYKATDYHSSYR
eukprot:GEMP01038106.1.p1 GENE.GEMP01038106.1~~GEMP01038106.1.p1  ORF type:complete len:206 (+),score=41.48 GEMP01038106.1:182-799(+)